MKPKGRSKRRGFTRKFGKERYSLHATRRKKTDAKQLAERIRRQGRKARIVPSKEFGWKVFSKAK